MSDPTSAGDPQRPSVTAPPVPDRRGHAVALAVLAAGGVLLLLAHGRTWANAVVGGSGLPTVPVSLSGSDINPAGTAVAVLALAGVAGLLATRRVGRVLIGVLLVLAGVLSAVTAAAFGLVRPATMTAGDSLTGVVTERVGVDAVGGTVSVTAWWLLALVAGLLVGVAGLLAVLRSGRWPQLGRRYERVADRAGDRERSDAGGSTPRPESAWDQMDRGVDPTVGPGSGTSDTMTTTPVEEDPR